MAQPFIDYVPMWLNQIGAEKQAEICARRKKQASGKVKEAEMAHTKKDSRIITDAKLSATGEGLLFLQGSDKPIHLLPDTQAVMLTAYYKRLIYIFIKNLGEMSWLGKLITLWSLKYNFKVFPAWFEYLFELQQVLLKDECYSEPVKELRRVLTGKIDKNILDAITLVFEMDSAYRYRMQDVFGELLKKHNLEFPEYDGEKWILSRRIDAKKDILFMLDILAERDKVGGQREKWLKIKKIVKLALFIPKIQKEIRDILLELDLDKIKFNEDDLYWIREFGSSYNYLGEKK